jgi:hypothetical protein
MNIIRSATSTPACPWGTASSQEGHTGPAEPGPVAGVNSGNPFCESQYTRGAKASSAGNLGACKVEHGKQNQAQQSA